MMTKTKCVQSGSLRGKTMLVISTANTNVSLYRYTVFNLITAPALITAPTDFLLYFHLLSPTWQSFSWLFTLFWLIIAHLTIFSH